LSADGFLAYSFKMMVIGYYPYEEGTLTAIGIALVGLVILGVILKKVAANQDRQRAEKVLRDKYEGGS
jgi:hypothetical protein